MSSFYSTSEDGTLNVMDNYATTAGSLGQELFIEVAREPNAPLMSCGILDVREDDQVTVIDRSEVVRFRDFLNDWLAIIRRLGATTMSRRPADFDISHAENSELSNEMAIRILRFLGKPDTPENIEALAKSLFENGIQWTWGLDK